MSRLIIGISGYRLSGKSSVSQIFVQNNGFVRGSFADKIREMMVVLGVPMEVLLDPIKKEQPHPALCGQTPRHAMETIGTKWGREMIHPSLWLNQFILATSEKPMVICDDVRYQNEVDTIRNMGGHVYRLRVPGREPLVPTDHAVDGLENVEDITNVVDPAPGKARTRIMDIYSYIHGRTFSIVHQKGFDAYLDGIGRG